MIRKQLPRKESSAIERRLPKLDDVLLKVTSLSPDFISINFSPGSSIPMASVCLRDTVDILCDVEFALFEAFAHKVWFEKHESPNKLELSRKDLAKHRSKKRASQKLENIGRYLAAEQPSSQLTKTLQRLLTSNQWTETINYRNKWVHSQPPLVDGFGIVYERRNRWIVSKGSVAVTFGGGDKPEYSIKRLLGFIQGSSLLFSEVVQQATNDYVALLSRSGIEVRENKLSVTL